MNKKDAGRKLRTSGSHTAAQTLGREGGKSKSLKKVIASRRNGRKHTGD